MRISYVETDAFFDVRGREAVFTGVSGCGGVTAVGRLYFFEREEDSERGGAVIVCLFERPCERELDSIIAELSPVGIILSAAAISPRLLEQLMGSGIPYLILRDGFSAEYSGRVAMLDTERDVIIINPGLEAIDLYSGSIRGAEAVVPGRAARECTALLTEDGRSGIMIDTEAVSDPGGSYSTLMETAESFCGASIAVRVTVPRSGSGRERFRDIIESVYRAAVYGSFSIYLGGYTCEDDLKKAFADMHRVFCRLEEDGREFNGYLKKGIAIDSPLWLFRSSPFLKADAICYDMDALTARIMGCAVEELSVRALDEETLLRIWEQYFSRFAPECKRIAVAKRIGGAFLEHWRAASGADEIYGTGRGV